MAAENGRAVTVARFEDLIAWQKARGLTREIYRVTKVHPFAQDRALSSQLQRASVSIMANLAEGFERAGRAEFHQFLSMAKASCAETRSLLYVALDAGYLDEPTFDSLMEHALEVTRVIAGLRTAVARQRTERQSPAPDGSSTRNLSPKS